MQLKAGQRLFMIVASVAILASFASPLKTQAATLQQLLQQQTDLQNQAAANKKKLEQKKKDAANLQDAISGIDDDIAYTQQRIANTQAQITATNAVIDALSTDIASKQSELDTYNSQLKSAYVSLYEMSQVSLMETVLSSNSLSDAVTNAQFVQQLQSDLSQKVTTVTAIKTDLESKRTESQAQKDSLVSLNNDLSQSNKTLSSQKNQKSYLLAQTQGEQANYEALLKKLQAQQESLSSAIYQARLKDGNGVIGGGSGGYPWPNAGSSDVDPWLFYKRQCVSYTAWKWQASYGQVFYNTRPGQGSAWNWPALAGDQGYHTSSTPRAGAVVSWPVGSNMPYGHVAWVESVNGNGTINVSEYNWAYSLSFDTRQGVNPYKYGTPTYIYP